MKIHFAGIGGVGMAALAILKKGEGCCVSGCDAHPCARTRYLESIGIPVADGHDPSHARDCDLLVYSAALRADNPEILSAPRSMRRGEMLADIVSRRESIAVAGTHGKTTTSTYIAKLLSELGEDVAWAIGGESPGMSPGRAAKGVLVAEADESDATLALYRPTVLVVTNCEWDHPDRFKTPEEYRAVFDAVRSNSGTVVESELLEPLARLEEEPCFAALAPHNRKNARAAVEVALLRGYSLDAILSALPKAVDALPCRRFQMLREADGMAVVADYAHHPTEMSCAVAMARKICAGRLCVLFQPHRYSRTKAFLGRFPESFALADEVVLCPTYAAFESPVEGGDSADIYAECVKRGNRRGTFFLARSCEEAWFHARRRMREGDVTLLLGAGDIISLERLVKSWENPPCRRIWIGAGTNTWRSDLDTGEVYERTSGRVSMPGAALGIPWMAGIPGTVGGWIKMNAGAFGHSFSEVLKRVKIDGVWYDVADCGFGYRRSAIKGEIQDFELVDKLPEGDAAEYLSRRRNFPPGTKGSVFKNPPDGFAGRLLEEALCKGLRVGGAHVWEDHANVIVLEPGGSPSDFLALAQIMRRRVQIRCGVLLEYEVCGLDATSRCAV